MKAKLNRLIDHCCLFNRCGRFIDGVLHLIDGLLMILSLGNYDSTINVTFIDYRMNRRLNRNLYDPVNIPKPPTVTCSLGCGTPDGLIHEVCRNCGNMIKLVGG
jgi:hypothetical protein